MNDKFGRFGTKQTWRFWCTTMSPFVLRDWGTQQKVSAKTHDSRIRHIPNTKKRVNSSILTCDTLHSANEMNVQWRDHVKSARKILCGSKRKINPVTGRGGPRGWDVGAPTFPLDNRLTDGGEVASLARRPPYILRKIPHIHLYQKLSRPPGPQCGWDDYNNWKIYWPHREPNPWPPGLQTITEYLLYFKEKCLQDEHQ
jgi:hypothetical protein